MWRKLGKLIKGHAQLPVAHHLRDLVYRVFVTDRTNDNRSYIRFCDVDLQSYKVLHEAEEFAVGAEPYDIDGVMTSYMVEYEGAYKLFYTGWRKRGEKYKHCIACLYTDLDTVLSRKLVIDSDELDGYLCSSPCVVFHNGVWKMWFISGRDCGGWSEYGPRYTIRYAESGNGVDWEQSPVVFDRGHDEVFARPYVLFDGVWKMWYSTLTLCKDKAYRIGYATSPDGIVWKRTDEDIIGLSDDGWDSQSVAFPYVLGNHMFYSGNHFGRDGVGCAIRV